MVSEDDDSYDLGTISSLALAGLNKRLKTKERGDALEELFCYLLAGIPGIMTQRNGIDPFKGEEIDIVVANSKMAHWMQVFPGCFLVECKNWDARVGAKEIQAFESKLRHKSVALGVIVAANGVTGNQDDLTAAYHNIGMAQSQGMRILVVTLDDLVKVKTPREFGALLCQAFLKCVGSGKF